MIHYHGTPITPQTAALAALKGGHAFVSFARPQDLGLALDVCQSVALDNGAFSAWRSGNPTKDWAPYYDWVQHLHRLPVVDWAVIPDVIDGDEDANDALIQEWPWRETAPHIGAPVWHMHESLDRLERLATRWPRICIGSSGQWSNVGDERWWQRMAAAMNVICDSDGRPACKLHGLRMLSTEVFTWLPLASADSTSVGRNIGLDSRWRQSYTPMGKEARAVLLRGRIEAFQGQLYWDKTKSQSDLLEASA